MECLFCEKRLQEGVAKDFVCICDKCFNMTEKSEARMVNMLCELRDTLKQEKYDREME